MGDIGSKVCKGTETAGCVDSVSSVHTSVSPCKGRQERNPGPHIQQTMNRVWKTEQVFDSVVHEQAKAWERENMLEEEVNFLKDEVDRLEMVLRKDNLKFLGIPESAKESYKECAQKVVDALNDAGEMKFPFTKSDIQQDQGSTAGVTKTSHAL